MVNSRSRALPFIRNNFDSILASIGAVFSLVLIAYLQIKIDNPTYTITGILALLACVTYLALKQRQKLSDIPSILSFEAAPSILLLFDIIFFALFIYSLWSFAFRPETYVRPLEYFIIMAAMSAILAAKILFLPSRNSRLPFTLFQIIIITLSSQWSVLLLFPDMVGMDTWVHRLSVADLLDSGHLGGLYGIYAQLPIMNLTIGATSLVTGLSYKIAAMLSVSLLQAVCNALFIFLIGRLLFNAKIGLLAALLMGIANYYILFGYWTAPNFIGATLVVIILYLVLKFHKDRSTVAIPICGLLMVVLLLTHVIAALWLALLLFAFWLGFVFYKKLFKERVATRFLLAVALIFTAALLSWWTFGTGSMQTIVFHLQQGQQPGPASLPYPPGTAPSEIMPTTQVINGEIMPPTEVTPPPEVAPPTEVTPPPEVAPPTEVTPPPEVAPPSTETLSSAPFEFLFNSLGMLLFFALSFIGVFYMLSRKFGNPYTFYIAIAGILILGIGYFPMLAGYSLIEHRWWYMAEILLSIPLAVTFSLLLSLFKRRYLTASLVIAVIFVLTFLSIIGFPSNQTNRTFSKNQVVRFALTTSESQAIQTVSVNWKGTIGVDAFYARIKYTPELMNRLQGWGFRKGKLEWIQTGLLTNDFSRHSSRIFLIREEIVNQPFGSGQGNYYRLNYDPRQALTEQGFHKVYDSGSVSGFSK